MLEWREHHPSGSLCELVMLLFYSSLSLLLKYQECLLKPLRLLSTLEVLQSHYRCLQPVTFPSYFKIGLHFSVARSSCGLRSLFMHCFVVWVYWHWKMILCFQNYWHSYCNAEQILHAAENLNLGLSYLEHCLKIAWL